MVQVKSSIRISRIWLNSSVVIFVALVGCHDILILGKNPIKWRQRSDMTIAVDWDIKHQFKQIKTIIVLLNTKETVDPSQHG